MYKLLGRFFLSLPFILLYVIFCIQFGFKVITIMFLVFGVISGFVIGCIALGDYFISKGKS